MNKCNIDQFKMSLIMFILLFGLFSCKRENPPDPYDPCKVVYPTTANFTIREAFLFENPQFWVDYDTDTLLTYGAVFQALERPSDGATFEWKLGSETIRTRSFYREEFPSLTPITVSLKVIRQPWLNCFPTDDGVDFKSRQFVFLPPDSCRVYGEFEGINVDEPSKVFRISFKILPNPREPKDEMLRINNLIAGCNIDYDNFLDVRIGYKKLYFGFNRFVDCLAPEGVANVYGTNNDSLAIDYTRMINNKTDQRVQKKFKGKRVK